MKTREITLVALVASVIATGCVNKVEAPAEPAAPAAPAVDLAAEEAAIRNRSGEWMNFANARDAASIVNGIFAPDALLISDGKAYKDTATLLAMTEAEFKKTPNAVVSWTSDRVRLAESGDLAVEIGSYNYDPDGDGKEPAVQGSFATTWVKNDGQWRVLTDAGGDSTEGT